MNKSTMLLMQIQDLLNEIETFDEKFNEIRNYYYTNVIYIIDKIKTELIKFKYSKNKTGRISFILYHKETCLIDKLPKIKLNNTNVTFITQTNNKKYFLTTDEFNDTLSIWDIFHGNSNDEISQIIFAQNNNNEILEDIRAYVDIYIKQIHRLYKHIDYFILSKLRAAAIKELL